MDFNPNKIKTIIGLGNPGEEYADTYHNIGQLASNYLLKTLNSKFYILNSSVYMNESGAFVIKTLKKSDMKPDELLIIHDDNDIEIGKYKLSFGRGSAGHKGIESIIKSLKTKNFWRLRIGIGKLATTGKKIKAERLVLKKINKTNQEILNSVFEEIRKELLE